MSVLTYNNVTLPYCFGTQFSQEAVFDDKGGTDWCLMKFDITLQAVVNLSYINSIAPDVAADAAELDVLANAADLMAIIRTRLLQPRKSFSMKFNDVELIPKTQEGRNTSRNTRTTLAASTVDANNGPMPQSCTVTQTTAETFLIRYHIIAHYWENPSIATVRTNGGIVDNLRGNAVIFNRWQESVDIDGQNFSTRTREGTYRIRSDNATRDFADFFRETMGVLSVPRGWLRQAAKYTVSPDGMSIHYVIVDQEQFKMPPRPAYLAEGNYAETAARKGGYRRNVQVRIKLTGAKHTPQHVLVQTAIAVAASKLQRAGNVVFGTGNGGILESISVGVDMYRNIVECSILGSTNATGNITTAGGLIPGNGTVRVPAPSPNLTLTPFSDARNWQPPAYVRGYAGAMLHAAAYYDPSLRNTVMHPGEGQLSQGNEPGTGN